MKMPPVEESFFPFTGGLDQLTPAIAQKPGRVFDSQNYEPEISGGYSRINGYEAYDGRPSPSSAPYTLLFANLTPLLIKNSASFTRASSATYYNYAGVLKTAGNNVARIGYNPANLSATPQLILESAATNIITFSEQLDNAAWGKTATTISANAANAPDGNATADKIVESAANTEHFIQSANFTITTSAPVVASVFLKASGRTAAQLRVASGAGNFGIVFANINLTTGAVISSGAVGSGSTTAVTVTTANGYWRVTLSGTFDATVTSVAVAIYTYNGGTSYLGDGTSGILAWGTQLESGYTAATSYIVTTSTSATRAADVPNGMTVTATAASTYLPYDANKAYVLGDQVSVSGEVWQMNAASSTGNAPPATVWTDIGILTPSLGNTVTGVTSGAAGIVLGVAGSYLILGRVTGTFAVNEKLFTSTAAIGTVTLLQQLNGSTDSSLNADYFLLAANNLRTDIGAVPGSGPIRGVWVYKDTVYAFRDNAGATAGIMYRATTGGWVPIVFGYELQFNAGTAAINVGDTITNTAGTVTATVVIVQLQKGSYATSDAVGTLVITAPVGGTFAFGTQIKVGATQKATASNPSQQITRQPGGKLDFFNYNFTGSTSTLKMYGADGINFAFEFDGTNYVNIRTGMAADTPSHVFCHKNYLVLSFLGSVQLSAIGQPYSWTTVLGAAEITTGDAVTGFLPNGGTGTSGSALTIFTQGKTFTLYGSSTADFKLVNSINDIGSSPFTMKLVSNDAYVLGERGIQSLITTLTYGDFDYSSVSHQIQPFMTKKRGMETCSSASKQRNQYRVYFNDGSAVVVGLTGDKVSGMLILNYGMPVRCYVNATLTTGVEVAYFGSDDGFVYQDNVGTSFNGNVIESWCRLAFNNEQSPRVRKRFRRAILETVIAAFTKLNITYVLGYATPDTLPSGSKPDQVLQGAGGFWDQFTWDQFTWDAMVVNNPSLTIEGTEKNISILFYSKRAQDSAHTLQGLTLIYSPRRTER